MSSSVCLPLSPLSLFYITHNKCLSLSLSLSVSAMAAVVAAAAAALLILQGFFFFFSSVIALIYETQRRRRSSAQQELWHLQLAAGDDGSFFIRVCALQSECVLLPVVGGVLSPDTAAPESLPLWWCKLARCSAPPPRYRPDLSARCAL